MSTLEKLPNLNILPRSIAVTGGAELGFAQTEAGPRLAILGPPGSPLFANFEGGYGDHAGWTFLLGPTSPHNAAALRAHLSWLRPKTLGLRTSAGLGDRLGLAK